MTVKTKPEKPVAAPTKAKVSQSGTAAAGPTGHRPTGGYEIVKEAFGRLTGEFEAIQDDSIDSVAARINSASYDTIDPSIVADAPSAATDSEDIAKLIAAVRPASEDKGHGTVIGPPTGSKTKRGFFKKLFNS